ncbi:MAG: glutathione S-transferase family protein [Planctomycetota bacterium]|jgi:glutathione S-transferase
MSTLRLHTLAPSPNNVKVRIALGMKGLDYEDVPQDPQDRAPLIELTGQPLTPVLEHGESRLFDSGAILRYLDANFGGPRLFPSGYDEMKEVEKWEAFSRYDVVDSIGTMWMASVREALGAPLDQVEARLEAKPFLCGDEASAADVTLASLMVYQVGLEHPAITQMPFLAFVAENFAIDAAAHPRTHAWVRKLAAFDRWLSPAFA